MKRDDVEMIVGIRKGVRVPDDTIDGKAEGVRPGPAHLLHLRAAVDGMDLEGRLTLQERNPDSVGACAYIQDPPPGANVNGGHKD